ncbi:MAG: diacylglycerol kinase [Minisyncoccota bacterium]
MWKRFRQGLRYAFVGLKLAWVEESNFKIETGCAALALALGVYFRISAPEFALVAASIALVLMAEVFNTALEELCDKFQPTHDPHIAKIKDLAAAAVLLASAGALAVGLFIFIPHLS